MMEKGDSWQAGIEMLKHNRDKLEAQLGKDRVERLLFNLEEISLDITKCVNRLIDCASQDAKLEELSEIFDWFQYGSIPHILGHLETIEEILDNHLVGEDPESRVQLGN
ncbi:MAG: hypothetical protein GDA56_12980 [Hormoscilla sp. GM7CHS1pb]|nr:hypothetical protein [Hormoscilla sp. GM7CHS1pb]